MPTARASPPSVMILIVCPIALNATIEVRIAKGMEVAMIRVLRQPAQKGKDHESGQTRSNQCFPDHPADHAADKNRLIRKRCHPQLWWNCRRNLRQKRLDARDHVQC